MEGFLPTYPNTLTFPGFFLLEPLEVKVLHSLGPLPWAQPGQCSTPVALDPSTRHSLSALQGLRSESRAHMAYYPELAV